MRLAEDQHLRAQRRVSARAQDDVIGLQWPIDLLGQPRLDGEVARGIEADEIDRLVMVADAGVLHPQDLLRRILRHAVELRLGERIGVEHQIGRFDGQQRGGDVGQRAVGHHDQIGAQARQPERHADVDAAHQGSAGEDHAGPDGDGRHQEKAARLASSQVLQRQPAEKPSEARASLRP